MPRGHLPGLSGVGGVSGVFASVPWLVVGLVLAAALFRLSRHGLSGQGHSSLCKAMWCLWKKK